MYKANQPGDHQHAATAQPAPRANPASHQNQSQASKTTDDDAQNKAPGRQTADTDEENRKGTTDAKTGQTTRPDDRQTGRQGKQAGKASKQANPATS